MHKSVGVKFERMSLCRVVNNIMTNSTNNNVIRHSDTTATYMNTNCKMHKQHAEQGQLAIQIRIKIQHQGFVPDTVYVDIIVFEEKNEAMTMIER